MKRTGNYNYQNYLNTISLLRERVIANNYVKKTISVYKRSSDARMNVINSRRMSRNSTLAIDEKKTTNMSLKKGGVTMSDTKSINKVELPFLTSHSPSKKTEASVDTLSKLYNIRDERNQKLFSGFNFNERYNDVLFKRLHSSRSNKSLNNRSITKEKIVSQDNERLKKSIKRISSPLTRDKLTKDYDKIYKPIKIRLKRVMPSHIINDRLTKMESKITCLNLK
jgi:hypothetical protein